MKNFAPLFLSQSYQDTWDDYIRSLSSETFPVLDYVILTASNEDQAEGYRMQIEQRKDYLPTATHWIYRCAESACPVFWKSPVRKEEITVPDR